MKGTTDLQPLLRTRPGPLYARRCRAESTPECPGAIHQHAVTSNGESQQGKSLKINRLLLMKTNGRNGTALFMKDKEEYFTFLKLISKCLINLS